jgi:hypothetical protein
MKYSKPPFMECQTCGKPGHVERHYHNAWRMGYLVKGKEDTK